MKNLIHIYFVFAIGVFGIQGLKSEEFKETYLANGGNQEEVQKEESKNPAEIKKEETTKDEVQKTEQKNISQKPISEQNAEECSNTLNSNEKDKVLEALASCAVKNKENEKVQSALLNLVQNSDHEKIIRNSLLLLSNQKNKEIPKILVSLLKNEKFKNNVKLEYSASLVLYSTLSEETVGEAKQIYENQNSSSDEILKNLAENLLKKFNK